MKILSIALCVWGCAASLGLGNVLQSDPKDAASKPPCVIDNPGPEYADRIRMFQGISGIDRANNGRLWAAWYGGGKDEGPENYAMLATSADGGKTWSGIKKVIHAPGTIRVMDPRVWVDPQGRMWLFWAQQNRKRPELWSMRCDNPGEENPTWTAPKQVCRGVMLNKPTVLKNGTWLLPVAAWKVEEENSGAYVVTTPDGGETWTELGREVMPDRTFDEHMVVEKKDGSLWMLVRTSYGIGEAFSKDGGKTWSEGKPSSIPHIDSRFFIRRLPSGNLLLIRNNPANKKDRSDMTAYVSRDDGVTWEGGLLLEARKGVAYPDAAIAPDGTIYAIYDFDRQGEKKILLSVFKEADVLAGKWVTPGALPQVVINQAWGKNPSK